MTTTTLAVPTVRRRPPLLLAGAAALAATALAVAVLAGAPAPEAATAAERVAAAAEGIGEVTDFRAALRYSDGRPATTAVVSGDGYTVREGGEVFRERFGQKGGLAPFAASSEAVVLAAMSGSEPTALGQETLRGVETTHFRVTPDATAKSALAKLTPGELAWFELEYPDNVRSVDVWIADDLVRQIRVVQSYGPEEPPVTSTTEFFAFAGD